MSLERGAHVQSSHWPGVALWVIEPAVDEHGNLIVRMVGDDRDFEASADDLTLRKAAYKLAVARVAYAIKLRGFV